MQQCEVIAIESINQNQIYQVNINNWKKLGEGEDHVIFENIDSNDPLYPNTFIFCKHRKDQTPQLFVDLYEAILSRMQQLTSFILPKQRCIVRSNYSLSKVMLDESIMNQLVDSGQTLYLTINLRQPTLKWTHYLQFKPKSPIPDIYSATFISSVLASQNLSAFDISWLESRSREQRTRWFKKNIGKKQIKNYNPLDIFGFSQTKAIPFYSRKLKMFPATQPADFEEICKLKFDKDFHNILSDSSILKLILRLQILFLKPVSSIQQSVLFHFNQLNSHQRHQLFKVFSRKVDQIIESTINTQLTEVIERLYESHSDTGEQGKTESLEDKLVDFWLFLVSLTWRDISIFARFRMVDYSLKIQECELKILDYELKDVSRLGENMKKDRAYLLNYLKWKTNKSEDESDQ